MSALGGGAAPESGASRQIPEAQAEPYGPRTNLVLEDSKLPFQLPGSPVRRPESERIYSGLGSNAVSQCQ